MLIWVDGRRVTEDEAAVTALDHGLTVGDGVFETLKVEQGRPFALTRHVARLARSAAGLGLEPDLDAVHAGIAALLAEPGPPLARLRVTVTGGPGPLGSDRGGGRPTTVVALGPLPATPATAAVRVVPWTRNEHSAVAGLKTTSYAENVVALAYARAHGADEAVFANTAGRLCEGTGSNVFCAVDGVLMTPPLTAGCLAGVTRELLLEWVPGIVERDLPVEALGEAAEAFLTSTTRDVQAIARVDGQSSGEAPGPLSREAARVFRERAAEQPDP